MVDCECQECKTHFEYEYRISICDSCLSKKGMTLEDIFNKGLQEGRKQPLSKIKFKMTEVFLSVPQPTVLKLKFENTWKELEEEFAY